jgi:hypothetical protein
MKAKILFIITIAIVFASVEACTLFKSQKSSKEAKNYTQESKARLASVNTLELEKLGVPKASVKDSQMIELRKKIEVLQRSENTAKVQMDRIEAKQDLILKQQDEARIKYIESLLIMREMMMILSNSRK